MIIRIPSLLQSYTRGENAIEMDAPGTLGETLVRLDSQFPGLRFRIVDEQDAIRPHIKFFVDGELARRLDAPTSTCREVMIVGALSGG